MACYHFTLKTDKKPDGTFVEAIDHSEYINRQGKYQNIDFESELKKQVFSGNAIGSPETNAIEGKNHTAYRSLFGSIKDNDRNVLVSDHASSDTIDIALFLSMQKFGHVLDVQGSDEFKAKVIVAAAAMNLPVRFKDHTMNDFYQEEDMNKGKRVTDHGTNQQRKGTVRKPNAAARLPHPPAPRTGGMYSLSECPMVFDGEGTEMLLQTDVHDYVDEQKTDTTHLLRRNVYGRRRRIKAKMVLQKINKRRNEGKGKTTSSEHADYINRNDRFAVRGGCIFQAHHLPRWANDSPKKFFEVADMNEVTAQ